MWRNNGNGTFTDVTDATGLVGLTRTAQLLSVRTTTMTER